MGTEHAFDRAGLGYDAAFTSTPLGRLLRQRVWDALAGEVRPGQRVLELGCGTGEDAVWLAERGVRVIAADPSRGMLAEAEAKLRTRGVRHAVQLLQAGATDAATALRGPFDGVFSDFGALNCEPRLEALGQHLPALLRPGGWAVLVVLNRIALPDLARNAPRPWRAVARLRGTARLSVGGPPILVRYPTIAAWTRLLGPSLQLAHVRPLGALLPLSQEGWLVDAAPAAFRAADSLERSRVGRWLLAELGDHAILTFRRR